MSAREAIDQAWALRLQLAAAAGNSPPDHLTERVWCLWADCDGEESVEALAAFRPRPSIVVWTSPSHLQAWWPLRQPTRPAWAKRVIALIGYWRQEVAAAGTTLPNSRCYATAQRVGSADTGSPPSADRSNDASKSSRSVQVRS